MGWRGGGVLEGGRRELKQPQGGQEARRLSARGQGPAGPAGQLHSNCVRILSTRRESAARFQQETGDPTCTVKGTLTAWGKTEAGEETAASAWLWERWLKRDGRERLRVHEQHTLSPAGPAPAAPETNEPRWTGLRLPVFLTRPSPGFPAPHGQQL